MKYYFYKNLMSVVVPSVSWSQLSSSCLKFANYVCRSDKILYTSCIRFLFSKLGFAYLFQLCFKSK